MKIFLCILSVLFSSFSFAEPAKESQKTISQLTSDMQKQPGYFTYYRDHSGKLWLEIKNWDQEFLYLNSLPAGIGSNDIGLDRGQQGDSRIVKFYRSGSKVLLIQMNSFYRSGSTDPVEKRTVEESFAQSVLWGFTVAAEDGSTVVVDATDFFLNDIHGVAAVLKSTEQGDYRLEASRSALYDARTKNFPQNTEVEALLTFVTQGDPGEFARAVAPNPRSITVREHHSFVQLPEAGFKPRQFDPRAGYFDMPFMDYATAVGEPVRQQYIARHRLAKKDPAAAVSDPVEPIVYYIDPGAPEPIRSALLEGALWWNQAFEAAGYRNAFQVKLLPADVDPMDVRYNTLQWVHRATRGWSYGATVYDPRTGEIIKGHVTLGSLRIRQDYMIAEGLLAPYEEGKEVSPEMLQMALARIRQLSAHEVGHTLGLSHNYIASTVQRASVMDYPQPLVQIRPDKTLDLSQAYGTEIGEWDKVAIAYGYQDYPSGVDEKSKLQSILTDAMKRNLIFLTDEDARPTGSSHPLTHLWDNGTNATDEMAHVLQVRQIALQQFSEKNIRPGTPMALLEEVLVPIYLYHRYQVQATAKVLGGVSYTYALKGDGQKPLDPVPPEEQRRALEGLLKTLQPEVLAVPEKVLQILPPHPAGYPRTREVFRLHTGATFDPLAAAESAAGLSAQMILHPQRAARLVQQHAIDPKYPGLEEVLSRVVDTSWKAPRAKGFNGEIQRTVDVVILDRLMWLASSSESSSAVQSIAASQLDLLREWLARNVANTSDAREKSHEQHALSRILHFQDDPKEIVIPEPLEPPAGAPIGSFDCDWM